MSTEGAFVGGIGRLSMEFAQLAAHPVARTLDARGMACPLPLLKTKVALRDMAPGEQLQVIATDAGAWRDIPAFVRLGSLTLIGAAQLNNEYLFVIQKN